MHVHIIHVMGVAWTENPTSENCGSCPAVRTGLRRGRLTAAAALLCLLLGPPTGILHAIHLATAHHDHDADACPVCQQVVSTSKCVLDSPTEATGLADVVCTAAGVFSERCPETFLPPGILPRGPPTTLVR